MPLANSTGLAKESEWAGATANYSETEGGMSTIIIDVSSSW